MTPNRIHVLPESVKKQIAAGEVVEGPFSVVKELMENSIDAGASRIDVEADESGLKRILVGDDGYGIAREDLPLAVMEHATSKIRRIDDISGIITYGFRGEALSSVSAISRLTLLSRSGDEETGGRIVCRDGKIEAFDYAGPRGTTVIVENLFYNTPARKKFLRSPSAEMKNIRSVFFKTALPHAGIAFSLSADGRRAVSLPAAAAIEDRIERIYGAETLAGLESGSLQDIRVRVHGFISKPHFLKSTRSLQLLYVNGRPVEYRYFGFLLSRAYEGMLPRGKHPAAVIMIDIEPGLVDVNIHPAKREVKFFDQRYIDGLIVGLCGKILGERIHSFPGRSAEAPADPAGVDEKAGPALFSRVYQPGPAVSVFGPSAPPAAAGAFTGTAGDEAPGSLVNERQPAYDGSDRAGDYRLIGVVLEHFILVEEEDSLVFIDFHAAHERILYDSLMAKDEPAHVQELMFPLEVELGTEELLVLMEVSGELSEIGFDIEEFSDRSVVIRGVPAAAPSVDGESFLRELAEALHEGAGAPRELRGMIAARAACHSAKRTGDAMSAEDMRDLVEQMLSGRHLLRCPHGRPCVYRLEKNEMERIFKRA